MAEYSSTTELSIILCRTCCRHPVLQLDEYNPKSLRVLHFINNVSGRSLDAFLKAIPEGQVGSQLLLGMLLRNPSFAIKDLKHC